MGDWLVPGEGFTSNMKMLCQKIRQEGFEPAVWGAMPFGKRYDSSLTRVEAYRKGMQAIIEGAGKDSFILGCNAPMWPSLGLVHGMRVSGDIARDWGTIKSIARETFYRNWQNNNLWLNDPDCIVLQNQQVTAVAPEEFMFHAAYIYASGGMRLAGDDQVLSVVVKCEGCKTIKNFWTGELYELPEQGIVRRTLKPHSAELWECY